VNGCGTSVLTLVTKIAPEPGRLGIRANTYGAIREAEAKWWHRATRSPILCRSRGLSRSLPPGTPRLESRIRRKETDECAGDGSLEQIVNVLKERQAGIPVVEFCRKQGISDATFYAWHTKYGGMEVSDGRSQVEGARG
jgi:hypothetical protein